VIALGLAGSIAYSLVSLILGVRLLRLARRTHQLPELLIGIMFISGGMLGHTLAWAFPFIARVVSSPLALVVLEFVCRLGIAGGCAATLVAAWRIFRPDRPWAGVLVGVMVTMLVPFVLPKILMVGAATAPLRVPLYWGWSIASVLSYGWMAGESLNTQSQMRRRNRLGLGGDPALTGRLLLWGLGTGAKALLFASLVIYQILAAVGIPARLPQSVVVSGLGLFCSVCLWLAFFPPRGSRLADRPASAEAS